ncbi:MAG: hypothetical protein IT473_11260, partial [Lysobacter sp.]|nr:hypothetical protein [Lysobacter sp.]
MSELHPISDVCKDSARRDTRRADVVFVHGLMGDPFATWRHGESDENSWPHWVAKAFPDVGVWSLGYPAALSKWPRWVRQFGGLFVQMQSSRTGRGHAMQLQRRAVNALDRLTQKGLGKRPLIFVCHSLGGLLVKQMLHAAMMSREPREKAIAEAVSDVMFLATPHHGADLADLAKGLSTLLQATVIADDLKAHGAHLQELAEDYKTHAEGLGIQTHTYYEDIGVLGSDVLVVNSTSANPGIGRRPVALDRDHGSICKPLERDDPVCERLREILEASGKAKAAPALESIEGQIVTTRQPQPVQAPPLQVHVQVHVPQPQSALDQIPTTPCQLPQAASKFFGREDALDALVARLRAGNNTVVIGAAGMGKTALAAEALHRILGESTREGLARSPFAHGIVFVDLYLHGGMAEKAWSHIANSVRGANFDPDRPADARAA